MVALRRLLLIGLLALGSCWGVGAQSRIGDQPASAAGESASSSQDGPQQSSKVLGQLGEVSVSDAVITRPQAGGSSRQVSVKKGTYVTVAGQYEDWYGVLMTDGTVGWIAKSQVRLMPYNVLAPDSDGAPQGSEIVRAATEYLGMPYRWGGYDLEKGTDCSGFVKMVFSRFGIDLPRHSGTQANVGQRVEWSDLQPGDRIYFATKGKAINHCGIYIGGRYFIHESSKHDKVAIDDLSDPFYLNSLVIARR
jgi:cell wall-associated NlpC family hydrolase